MPVVNIYNKDIRGTIGFFGTPFQTNLFNTIAPTTTPGAGGTVISSLPDTYGSVFGTWNSETGGWSNWNPSSAIIPPSSNVEYAFLVWSTAYFPPTIPQQEILANTKPITLIKPDGSSYQVTPDPNYNINLNTGWWQYTHGADITSIMRDNQYGDYTVLGVPTGIRPDSSSGISSGAWGIYIVYSDQSYPYRNINLNVGATGFNQIFTIPNLILPATGPVSASVYLESVQGDRSGTSQYPDSLLLNGTTLSGPFNPADDFMNSRFVDYTGTALQTKGSLIVQTGTEYASRADQTVVTTTTALTNTDTQAVIKQVNSRDWAGVAILGFMVDLYAANLIAGKVVDKANSAPGDILTYTVTISNTGTTTAINVIFIDTLPNGLTFVPNSLYINGNPNSGNISSGVTIPVIPPNTTDTIVFKAQIPPTAEPGKNYNNSAVSVYSFNLTATSIINGSVMSNISTTTVVSPSLKSVKSVDKNYAAIGDTLTYTINISNIGNTSANNLVFTDTVPNYLTLVPSSINVSAPFTLGSPDVTVKLTNALPISENITITFKAIVNTIPL